MPDELERRKARLKTLAKTFAGTAAEWAAIVAQELGMPTLDGKAVARIAIKQIGHQLNKPAKL